VLLSVALIRKGAPLLAWAGVASAVPPFSTLLSVVGIASPLMLTLSGILWQFWTLALAIWLIRRGQKA